MNEPEHDQDNAQNKEQEYMLMDVPKINQLPMTAGLAWIGESFNLFSKNPSIWIVMLVIYIGIGFILTNIPFMVLLPTLLTPVFNAGFIYAAKAVDNGAMLEIDHLFAGFKLCLRNLFRLGMLYFFVNLLIIAAVSISIGLIIDESTLSLLAEQASRQEIEKTLIENPILLTGIFKAFLLGMILSIPLMMASWFAPSLVLFDKLRPLQAMLLSFKACNKNIFGFIIYLLIMFGLVLLALVPLGLGLLVMIPIIFISQYCSYKAVFSQQKSDAGVFIV